MSLLCRKATGRRSRHYILSIQLPHRYLTAIQKLTADPLIRKKMEINLESSVIILDEAHNIEDVCADVAGYTCDLQELQDLREQLKAISLISQYSETYTPLWKTVAAFVAWADEIIRHQRPQDLPVSYMCCTADLCKALVVHKSGEEFVKILAGSGLTLSSVTQQLQLVASATTVENSEKSSLVQMTSRQQNVLEGFYKVIDFMFMHEMKYQSDFCVVLSARDSPRRSQSQLQGRPLVDFQVKFLCLSPAVGFSVLSSQAHSIILSSGTLCPLETYQAELGTKFDITLEAPHAIDTTKQVWVGCTSQGPDEVELHGTFENTKLSSYQDSVGYPHNHLYCIT